MCASFFEGTPCGKHTLPIFGCHFLRAPLFFALWFAILSSLEGSESPKHHTQIRSGFFRGVQNFSSKWQLRGLRVVQQVPHRQAVPMPPRNLTQLGWLWVKM